MGKPKLPDIATFIQAGIDPKTRLPSRLVRKGTLDPELFIQARRVFRIQDEQRAVNRFVWRNLPAGISSQELERLLYYRYSLILFYSKDLEQFCFLPYALNGTIDLLGRFNTVNPVPIAESSEYEKSSEFKKRKKLLQEMKLTVVKDVVVDLSEITEELLTNSCVILRDYTNQLGQKGDPRWSLNDKLIELEAACVPFVRTNLILATGIQGLRVVDADTSDVEDLSAQLYDAALTGKPYVGITAKTEMQELQPKSTAKASEYFLALQSIDNLLLQTYGIENTGLYEKKAHILESENQVNANNVSLVLADSLRQRQNFCNIVNSIWDLGIWCEISEELLGYDINGDGVNYEEATDGKQSGYSTEEGGEE